jgi:hypothetical protein
LGSNERLELRSASGEKDARDLGHGRGRQVVV